MKQVLVTNPRVRGFAYGTLHDFEDEIARQTGALAVAPPDRGRAGWLERRAGHGMRLAGLRPLLRRSGFGVSADVAWAVLMSPEDWELDLWRGWDRGIGYRILYLYDTFESQLPAIRRVLGAARWDLAITSFAGATGWLERETGRKWHAVPQGVCERRFGTEPAERRVTGFCAYGRRLAGVHASLREFSEEAGCGYAYTVASGLLAGVDSREAYGQYARDLRHAWFNVCWPVEVTNPGRARTFSPITCRWFEAAASGNVVVGRAPRDEGFREMFGADFVVEVDPAIGRNELAGVWRELWGERERHLTAAQERREERMGQWTWARRVKEIESLAGFSLTNGGSGG